MRWLVFQKQAPNGVLKMINKCSRNNNNENNKKGIKKSKQATTALKGQRKQSTKITVNNLFTFIEISQRHRYSPLRAFIRLLTLRYKRQDRSSNGDSEITQSSEDTLRVNRTIVV